LNGFLLEPLRNCMLIVPDRSRYRNELVQMHMSLTFLQIKALALHLIQRIWLLLKVHQLSLMPSSMTLCLTLLTFPSPFLHPLIYHMHVKNILMLLDEHIVSTRDGGVQRFLVRWRGRPTSDCTWITSDELQQLDPDLLEYYQSYLALHSMGQVLPTPRELVRTQDTSRLISID
jgi:hypothetical protein